MADLTVEERITALEFVVSAALFSPHINSTEHLRKVSEQLQDNVDAAWRHKAITLSARNYMLHIAANLKDVDTATQMGVRGLVD